MEKVIKHPIMNKTRYFRDGECYWKFDPDGRPKQKHGFYSEWEDSYFQDLEEFMRDPGPIQEIGAGEAESAPQVENRFHR